MCCTPCFGHQSPNVPEVNWVPLLVVMRAGTPKRATHVVMQAGTPKWATQVVMNASSTVSTSMWPRGTASSHLVERSIIVSR